MSAYVIVEVSIHDHDLYEQYKKLTPAAVSAFDGRFVVRGGQTQSLEGDWNPERFVILEFPSMERAREWYNSDQYTHARLIRQRASHAKMLLVEGA